MTLVRPVPSPNEGRAPRRARALLGACALAALLALPALAPDPGVPPAVVSAFETIRERDVETELSFLASSTLEGRDSPSAGLTRAAEHVAARLKEAGYVGAGKDGAFVLPFTRKLPKPDADGCLLEAPDAGDGAPFALGVDFVPVVLATGEASGEAVLIGFGIDDGGEKYDDIPGNMSGKVAVIVSGEPRHKKKFEGPEVTAAADLYAKLAALADAKAEGALVVRRPPPADDDGVERGKGEAPEDAPFGFRHTWAAWATERMPAPSPASIPALELTPAAARRLLGVDPLAFVGEVDVRAKPPRPLETGRAVHLRSAVVEEEVEIPNVAAVFRGSDQGLADEYVVLGAHMDHVGVDVRGRIGFGADDNASGVSALLEVATALAQAAPRRSILACGFGAEEDGLLGSRAFVDSPPVPIASMVAMLNMDMVGRGEAKQVCVLGIHENPGFEKLLEKARKLLPTKVTDVVVRQGQDLFERSDHFPFHEKGVPVLFFFEQLPISKNPDYHTWRDTIDLLDLDKITRTARLVFATAWMIADDDERPPAPR